MFTLRPIVFGGKPVLRASHDEDDHGWQFLGAGDADMDDAALVSLSEMVTMDPRLVEMADLPPGWRAWRPDREAAWRREPKPSSSAD